MKPVCSVFIATSLDGFIARKDGSLDWLPGADGSYQDDEDYGYNEFITSIDTLVVGRNTYEFVTTFDEWPYRGKRVVVMSSAFGDDIFPINQFADGTSLSPPDLVRLLEEKGSKHIYVDGGQTIQNFLAHGLIDTLTITHIPVLIGEGIPLFGPLPSDIHLNLVDTKTFYNGFVQTRYRVVHKTTDQSRGPLFQ